MKKETTTKDVKDIKKAKDEAAATVASIPAITNTLGKTKAKRSVGKIVCFTVIFVIAAVYAVGVFYSMNFFYGNTSINGVDVSNISLKDADKKVQNKINEYKLDVEFTNETDEIKVGDAGVFVELEKSIKEIKKDQNPFVWFLHFGRKYNYQLAISAKYDEQKLSDYIMGFNAMNVANMTDSKDAYIDFKNGEPEIVKEELGTKLEPMKVIEAVKAALDKGDSLVSIYNAGCYIPAEITADSPKITKGFEEIKSFTSMEAKYDFAGYTIGITKEELASMLDIDKDGNATVSKEKVYDFARKFAEKYTTTKSERKIKIHTGDIIGVYGENYGWEIDGEKEAVELYELICKKQSFVKEPAYTKKGYAMGEMNDLGGFYIEIDLTNQHLYFYKDYKVVLDSDIVSGWVNNPNHYKTPGGLFAMDNKAYKATLTGPGYSTPVEYWMGFNGGIGIHDALWRSKFGGDIYLNDGSHGCINLPIDMARQVYELADPGMAVFCYYLDEVTHYDN